MDARYRSALVFVASQLVFLAALIHVAYGVQRWAGYAGYGILVPPDVRWPLFVGSGVAVVVGMALARRSARRRPWYLAGAVTMLGFVAAYFLWHLGGHRPLVVLGPATTHEIPPGFVVARSLAGPLETAMLTLEVLAAALFSVLYVHAED